MKINKENNIATTIGYEKLGGKIVSNVSHVL